MNALDDAAREAALRTIAEAALRVWRRHLGEDAGDDAPEGDGERDAA